VFTIVHNCLMSDEVDYPRAIGELVYALRMALGWTQESLANEAKLDRRWVLWLEKRQVRLDDLAKLTRLARALGLTPAEFWGRVVMPELTPGALREAAWQSFELDRDALHEALRRKYLDALTSVEATKILMAIAQFVAEGKPEIVDFVADMIGRGYKLEMAERVLEGIERLPPRQPWLPPPKD
jgi:transcriptional regulator with XRE-family HTH domain